MTEPQVRWKRWKAFSGPSIKGTVPLKMPDQWATHWERVFWLTTIVESGGMFGAVTMYDGTGVTADVLQKVLVFPRHLGTQGPLTKSMNRLFMARPTSKEVKALAALMEAQGWKMGEDGCIRRIETGALVKPRVLRSTISGFNGKTPRRGKTWETAKEWALAFHHLFVAPWARPIQVHYGQEYFAKMADRVKRPQIGKRTVGEVAYSGHPFDPNPYMEPSVDLALAVFWSNSVNGPAPALKCLAKALRKVKKTTVGSGSVEFAKWLLRFLGNSTYGRWDDDIPGGRYQRTRKAAMKIYPRELFVGPAAVMPKDLPG